MNRILERGRERQGMTLKMVLMALVIAFFMGTAFMAVLHMFFKAVWG